MSFSPLLKSWIHKETLNIGYINWENDVPWQTADKEVLNVIQITVGKWPMLSSQQLKIVIILFSVSTNTVLLRIKILWLQNTCGHF